jgi:hypothetical protein
MTNNIPENDDAPWLNLTPQEVEELRYNKQNLTNYGREKIRALMEEKKLLKECRQTGRTTATTEKVLKTVFSQMNEDIQQPNGDFIKQYPDVTRVEVIGNDGREFVHYGCSNVKVSLQDDGRTIKVFLYTMFQQKEPKPMDDAIDRLLEKYKSQKLWNMLRNELGYSIDCCDEIVDLVERWLPKEQSAEGSQNTFAIDATEGFNHCLNKIKGTLR